MRDVPDAGREGASNVTPTLPAHIEDYRTTVDTLENIIRTYPEGATERIILQAAANIAGDRFVALARAWREEHRP